MGNKFTQFAQNALISAAGEAEGLGCGYIGSEHILLGLAGETECIAAKMLAERGLSYAKIKSSVASQSLICDVAPQVSRELTPRAKRIISEAARICKSNRRELIGSEHLLYCILGEDDCVAVKILEYGGIYVHELRAELLGVIKSARRAEGVTREGREERESALALHARCLNSLAEEGKIDPLLCREAETERLIRTLCRRSKSNPCLIGEPGVGKTAIAEGLATRICEGSVPDELRSKRIYALDVPSLVAGAKYRGEFEERIKEIIKICSASEDILLFIDEIHTIIGAGGAEGAIDAASIFKPALARGEIRVIGATTLAEYRKYIEHDSALERRFQPIRVNEPDVEDAVKILQGLRGRYEEFHRLKITDEAIEAAVRLSERYIGDRFLPDKAIDLIDEAASRVKLKRRAEEPTRKIDRELSALAIQKAAALDARELERAKRLRALETELEKKRKRIASGAKSAGESKVSVSEDDVAEVVTDWCGVPLTRLLEGESARLFSLEKLLRERIIGQDAAIESVSRAIRRGRVGLGEAERPMGAFIFVGPSGVGKTELCLALSEVLFGSRRSVLRFDMSEYTEPHSVSKLIGAPPGYVGYGESGLLTEKVRQNPYSLILFDEIEKAHREIYNLMLQILDNGTLTDSRGRVANFKNALIIMTSNIGSSDRENSVSLGFSAGGSESEREQTRKKRTRAAVENVFSAEFLGRVDEIIIFDSLGRESMEKICSLSLASLAGRLKGLSISAKFSPALVSAISERALGERYGARNIRREIAEFVESPLSEAILSGEIKSGAELLADVEDGRLILRQK